MQRRVAVAAGSHILQLTDINNSSEVEFLVNLLSDLKVPATVAPHSAAILTALADASQWAHGAVRKTAFTVH